MINGNETSVDELPIIQTGGAIPNGAINKYLFTWTKLSFNNVGFLSLKKYKKYFKKQEI